MKSRYVFSCFLVLAFSVACGRPEVCPLKAQQEIKKLSRENKMKRLPRSDIRAFIP